MILKAQPILHLKNSNKKSLKSKLVVCSNCKVISSEYKKFYPSGKGMGGRNVQGKFIP